MEILQLQDAGVGPAWRGGLALQPSRVRAAVQPVRRRGQDYQIVPWRRPPALPGAAARQEGGLHKHYTLDREQNLKTEERKVYKNTFELFGNKCPIFHCIIYIFVLV